MREKTDTEKKYAAWKKAEVPIIIGVSAHRNIRKDFEDAVADKVREFINGIKSACPNSPIYMLNGLAYGGDQLCADVAVEMGVKLIVAMPFAEKDYVNEVDFPLGSMDKFYGYENHVIDKFVVPDTEKSYGENTAESEKSRDYLFRQQGIYVATNCHVLLALWDGTAVTGKRLECGTNAAVGFALKHGYYQPNGMEFYPSDDGAVAWIFSPREGRAYGEKVECSLKYLVPTEIFDELEKSKDGNTAGSESKYYDTTDALPEKLVELLLKTDRFNRDYLEHCSELKSPERVGEGQYLLDREEYERIEKYNLEHTSEQNKAQAMVDCHNIASKLSGNDKKKNLHALMLLATMGMLLLLSFMVYDQLSFLWTSAICITTVVILIFSYVLIYAGEKRCDGKNKRGRKRLKFDVHTRFIEYRALSEALRVQYYMTMYGIEECVCRYFTWSHKSLMPWVRKAVIALNVGKTTPAWKGYINEYNYVANDNSKKLIISGKTDARSVFENKMFGKWIGHSKFEVDYNSNGQLGYHLQTIKNKGRAIKKRNTINRCALIITMIAYISLYVCELLPMVDLGTPIVWIFTWRMLLKCVLGTFTAVTFLITYYYGKQSLDLIQSDSLNMVRLYRIALDRANKIYDTFEKDADCENAIRSLVCELAREQLIENVTWVAYNRDSDIEMPI